MAAWAAWVQLAALAQFTRRRPGSAAGGGPAKAAGEELAWKTGESWSRMLDQASLAVAVTGRLPQTLAALGQGLVSEYKMRTIEAQTADLSGADVAKADVSVAAAGRVKTPPALRTSPAVRWPGSTRTRPRGARNARARTRTSASTRKNQGTPGCPPGRCRPRKRRSRGRTSNAVPWTCTPPARREPPGSSRSRPSWTSSSAAPSPARTRARTRTSTGARMRVLTRTRTRAGVRARTRMRVRVRVLARAGAGGAAGLLTRC